jgi:hypothetical protein
MSPHDYERASVMDRQEPTEYRQTKEKPLVKLICCVVLAALVSAAICLAAWYLAFLHLAPSL